MTLKELGSKLSEMYNEAPKGESVAMIHLFGVKYAIEINQSNYSKKDIIVQSGISTSYLTELSKGVKLAKYVIPKSNNAKIRNNPDVRLKISGSGWLTKIIIMNPATT